MTAVLLALVAWLLILSALVLVAVWLIARAVRAFIGALK